MSCASHHSLGYGTVVQIKKINKDDYLPPNIKRQNMRAGVGIGASAGAGIGYLVTVSKQDMGFYQVSVQMDDKKRLSVYEYIKTPLFLNTRVEVFKSKDQLQLKGLTRRN